MDKSRYIEIFDTTLRDGSQSKDVYFSLQDKLRIIAKLDDFGIPLIEVGWPGSNPKDRELFNHVKNLSLKQAKIVAFGSTRKANIRSDKDQNLNAIIDSDVSIAAIFGKAWDLHVTAILKTSLEENLSMVSDSIEYLRQHGLEVIFDAEHFFDGYKENREYAFKVLKAAEEAGARTIVLCDTNGGCLPHEVYEITKQVVEKLKTPIGLHCHNDSGNAVANSIQGVLAGASHVQGTINGIGERCGNADLCQIIPNLELKLGFRTSSQGVERLRKLVALSRYVYELAHLPSNPYQPFVGKNAFAHKGGVHVDAVLKVPRSYEHIPPELVGNQRQISTSELSGKANIIAKAREFGLPLDESKIDIIREVLNHIKEMEYKGYHLENADGTLYLIFLKKMGLYKKFFELKYARMTSETHDGSFVVDGAVKIRVDDKEVYVIAEGNGPVHAEDLALRKALREFFPEIERVQLLNYNVSIADISAGTASAVRVFIEFTDGKDTWITVGVSTNILEASKEALIDGYDYFLQKTRNPAVAHKQ